jgi:hypothetical protein
VVVRRVGGLRNEAAPVDVHDDGQLVAAVGGGRKVEADGVVAERDVLGLDARLGVEARPDRRWHQGTLEAAAPVHPEQRAELADHLVVLWHRRSGGGVGGRRHSCGAVTSRWKKGTSPPRSGFRVTEAAGQAACGGRKIRARLVSPGPPAISIINGLLDGRLYLRGTENNCTPGLPTRGGWWMWTPTKDIRN